MDEEKQVASGDIKLAGIIDGSETNVHGSRDIYTDPELEKRVMAKFDKYVLPEFAVVVLIAYLDRSNIGMYPPIQLSRKPNTDRSIGNAKLFGLEKSLGFVGNDFCNISTLF
jgi:hypothetical protein